ncbi:MAG: hypothetical protein AB7F86_06480 [Bdellovibrionales bacterium]
MFSIRDDGFPRPILNASGRRFCTQAGQGTIEYVLVLVVTVFLIMTALYTLNTAFSVWAKAYFGDYLSCLLETGELPSIQGSPGDSGVCNQLFKPFSITDGRPLKEVASGAGDRDKTSGQGQGAGSRERAGSGGGGAGNYQSVNRFGGGNNSRRSDGGVKRQKIKDSATYTGSTATGGGGGGFAYTQRPQKFEKRSRLNNKFAFDEEKEKVQKRSLVSTKSVDRRSERSQIKLKSNKLRKTASADADTSFNIADFIRYLIIAALVIALVMFIGGQVLKVGKSME